MIQEPPVMLGGDRFRQAEEEALATFTPKPRIFASGFLAGFLITWLPLALYGILYYWESTFGWAGILTNAERQWLANIHFRANVSTYIASAWPYSILLATWGLFLAFLRAFSCVADAYLHIRTATGPLRFGLHQLIMAVGLPVVGVVSFYNFYPFPVFRAWLLPLLLSGLVFNVSFRFLQNVFLGLFYRPTAEQREALALRVFLPRELGLRQVQVTGVHIDPEQRCVTVTGWFQGKTEIHEQVLDTIAAAYPGYEAVIDDRHSDALKAEEEVLETETIEE